MNRNFVRWALPAWIWGTFIAVMTSLPRIELPKTGLTFTDKILHAGVYFIFAFFVARARMQGNVTKSAAALKWTAVFCTVFAIVDEIHQIFIPNRFGDVADGLADIFGVFLALLFFKWIFVPVYQKRTWSLL